MNILKSICLIIFITSAIYSQSNITNTLGTGGMFIIKDVSNNYLTLNQSTGQMNILRTLRIENTTSPNFGVIYKGADRFIHNFGASNTFMGINSGNFTMVGTGNTALGQSSLNNNTTGYDNTALGYLALYNNTTGIWNTALGYGSLYSNTDGSYNTALGYLSLQTNNSGSDNTALGYGSLYVNTSGNSNTALGNWSLSANTEGTHNTASGYQALYSNTSGSYNTTSGYRSLYSNTTGEANTAFGYAAGSGITTGGLLTCIGHSAGSSITTGLNLTCLGEGAQPTTGDAANQITLGNADITSLRCNATTITSLSDARDKKKITELLLGIDFLMKLKPRQFHWDKRDWYRNNKSDGIKMKEQPTAGFIAQELDEAQTTAQVEWLNLVLKDNPERWEATPGNLLPVIVKAIQELKIENEQLKAQLKDLSEQQGQLAEIKTLKEELNDQLRILKVNNEDFKFSYLGK